MPWCNTNRSEVGCGRPRLNDAVRRLDGLWDSSRGKSRLQEKTAVQEGHRHSDRTVEEFPNIVTVAFAYRA